MADSGAVETNEGWETVGLYADDGPEWHRVSPRLAAARTVVASVAFGVVLVLVLVAGLLFFRGLLWGAGVVVLGWLWTLWVIRRQVSAISYTEQAEELVIRKGRIWRSLVSVPYGRLQLADMESGPVARRFGLASVQMHTAAPGSNASIPGLPLAEAEALRQRLTARGESQRAGL
jgi:uncharacterized protein